jgi:hypothetical protein
MQVRNVSVQHFVVVWEGLFQLAILLLRKQKLFWRLAKVNKGFFSRTNTMISSFSVPIVSILTHTGYQVQCSLYRKLTFLFFYMKPVIEVPNWALLKDLGNLFQQL